MSARQEISTYFSNNVSAFVANKFHVTIGSMDFKYLQFYAKKISLPYETLRFVEDIYVSDVTLAKPRNVLEVQTYSEISMTFRVDPNNTIVKELESIFAGTHNLSKFETVRNTNLFTIKVDVIGAKHEVKNTFSYANCVLFEMASFDVDASDRKFKEYEVKFICNRIGVDDYTSTKSSASIGTITNCAKLAADLRRAYDRFASECNKRRNPSPVNGHRMTKDGIIAALQASQLFNAYANAKVDKATCRSSPTEVRLGDDVPNEAWTRIYDMAASAGIPQSEVVALAF